MRNPARPTPAAKVIAAAHRARANAVTVGANGGIVSVGAGAGGGIKQATSDAYKVIVSNLPIDVEEAAVRVRFFPSKQFSPPKPKTEQDWAGRLTGTLRHHRR